MKDHEELKRQRVNALQFNFVTTSEIARVAQVNVSAVSNWPQRYEDFPEQYKGKLYYWPDVLAWLKEKGKL